VDAGAAYGNPVVGHSSTVLRRNLEFGIRNSECRHKSEFRIPNSELHDRYTLSMIDPDAFREFEHDGWQRAAEHYADAFGTVTAEAAGPLLDAVAAGSATQLLDVA